MSRVSNVNGAKVYARAYRARMVAEGKCMRCLKELSQSRRDSGVHSCEECVKKNRTYKRKQNMGEQFAEEFPDGEREPRFVHVDHWDERCIFGDPIKGVPVYGVLVRDPYGLLFKAMWAEALLRLSELWEFGQTWETRKATRHATKYSQMRARCRIHYNWIMDDEVHPFSLTLKELHELRDTAISIDEARDRIFEKMPDSAMKELFRAHNPGAIRLAREHYLADKGRWNNRRNLTAAQRSLESAS